VWRKVGGEAIHPADQACRLGRQRPHGRMAPAQICPDGGDHGLSTRSISFAVTERYEGLLPGGAFAASAGLGRGCRAFGRNSVAEARGRRQAAVNRAAARSRLPAIETALWTRG
jgi:hypothetical protein